MKPSRAETSSPLFYDMAEDILDSIIEEYTTEKAYAEDWNLEGFNREMVRIFGLQPDLTVESLEDTDRGELRENLFERVQQRYDSREREFSRP